MTRFNPISPADASNANDLIVGDDTAEAINALEGDDIVVAAGGDDTVSGGEGDDALLGGDGNDVLIGNTGDDAMLGGNGDDTMNWFNGDGSDLMDGGVGGFDVVNVFGASEAGDDFTIAASATGVTFARQNLGLFQLDIQEVEELRVNGGSGDDTITGSEGFGEGTGFRFSGDAGNDLITGTDVRDVLSGNADNDTLIGAKGNDVVLGGDGDDLLVWNNGDGSDQMIGGADNDRVQVNGADSAGDVFIIDTNGFVGVDFEAGLRLARTNLGPFQLDITQTETIEVNGQGGDDEITGAEGLAGLVALELNGGSGNDTITGGDGDDILRGQGGNDVLVGFKGSDVMHGGAGRDTMIWNNGDGSDQMIGGRGRDRAVVNGSDGGGDVFEITADGTDVDFARTNFGAFTLDISETEVLRINGLDGDDVVTGGEGLAGLIKLDVNGGKGNDKLTGGDGDDLLKGNVGDDVLVGFKGSDRMVGGNGDDRMIWNNGDGSDVMLGGRGRDTVEVNGSDSSGDVFTISGDGAGIDFARTNFGNFTLDIANVEVMEVNGQGGDDVITASEDISGRVSLRLDGGAGHDTITGGNTDDRIEGGRGHDELTGGTGDDVFVFTFGNDTITDFEQGSDVALIAGIEGIERWQDIKELIAQDGDDVVVDFGDRSLTFQDAELADFGAGDFDFL